MKLHLGCGPETKEGFINIDGYGEQGGTRGSTQRLIFDLTKGLPKTDLFGDPIRDVNFVCSTHFIEHLTTNEGIKLIKECYDVMSPGGVIRMGIPNYFNVFKAYVENNWDYFSLDNWDSFSNPQTRTLIDVVEYAIYQRDDNSFENHRSVWDLSKAKAILNHIGFKDIKEVPYDRSIEPNSDSRERSTFVVEAVR